MKKIFIVISFVIISAVLFFNACSKQEIIQNNNIVQQQTTDNTLNKILNFIDKTENPDKIKSGEMMSIDSAVWYIEAALNYKYCIKKTNYQTLSNKLSETVTLNIEFIDNKIYLRNIIDVFFETENSMINILKLLNEENKNFEIVDVFFNPETQQITSNVIINYGITESKYVYNIVGNWHWGNNQGMCDGSHQGTDLVDKIKTWINYNRAVLYNVTWTDVDTTTLDFVSDNGILPDALSTTDLKSYGVNMFFEYVDLPGYPVYPIPFCVSQLYCNKYAIETNQALDVIEDEFLIPINSEFRVIGIGNLVDIGYPINYHDYEYIVHRLNARYGIPHIIDPNQ